MSNETSLQNDIEKKLQKIKKDKESLPELRQKLNSMSIKKNRHEYNVIKNRIKEIETAEEDYMLLVAPLFLQENETCNTNTSNNFFQNNNIITVEQGSNQGSIYKEYLKTIEKSISNQTRKAIKCSECNGCNLIYDDVEAQQICKDCGVAESVLSTTFGSYAEEQEAEYVNVFTYKRSNHFAEHLTQLQAKENTTIPPEIIESLRAEFKKERVKNASEINISKVRKALKKLKLNKYYEHIPHITNLLNGIPAPVIEPWLEDRLKLMFDEIQQPFENNCPKDRKNFMSYSFVLYKMCELLEQDHLLVCFPLLKSTEKLYEQDRIWKKICEELKWEYIRTV